MLTQVLRWLGCGLLLARMLASEAAAVECGIGSWKSTELGNQRAVVEVREAAEAVWVRLPWRRRDSEPEKKAVWVYDAGTGQRVGNAMALDITREAGDVIFQPTSGGGLCYVHYLPYTTSDTITAAAGGLAGSFRPSRVPWVSAESGSSGLRGRRGRA